MYQFRAQLYNILGITVATNPMQLPPTELALVGIISLQEMRFQEVKETALSLCDYTDQLQDQLDRFSLENLFLRGENTVLSEALLYQQDAYQTEHDRYTALRNKVEKLANHTNDIIASEEDADVEEMDKDFDSSTDFRLH